MSVVSLVGISTLANAAELQDLTHDGEAVVSAVVDGDTVILDDGRELRLAGVQAPKLPLGRKDFKPWPLADVAKNKIEYLVLGKTVDVFFGTTKMDRHGRTLAHLAVEHENQKIWLQGEMLKEGLARVYTFEDNRMLADEMIAIERLAREQKVGIWAHPFYAIRTHNKTDKYIGTFQLVEGEVLDAQIIGKRAYLNFGPSWRTDFTVVIEKPGLKVFAKSNIDPVLYKGKSMRVRGWIKSKNGPMIEITHPEQIELMN